ncbi:MAG: hypothetical protein V3575_01150 [Candidatus Absconditabacteria bacterium]
MKNNTILKVFILVTYLITISIFIVILYGLALGVRSFNGYIFVIWMGLSLSIPIIYILSDKVSKKLLILWIIITIYTLSRGFQINQKTNGNYKLVCMHNCSKYNYNILNILSEKELLNSGYKLASLIGITKEQLDKFKPIQLEYENKVNINLPSQIPNALIDKKESKYILYSKPSFTQDKLFMVIHGSCGGFLFYQKFFKRYGDKYNTKVVMPTFGWGNWKKDGGIELIYETYYDLLNKGEINKNTEVILIGISNGGLGISRAIYFDKNNIFPKIIYISAVMENEMIQSKEFANNVQNKLVSIITGKVDDRVDYSNTKLLTKYFPNISTLFVENGDHFILLNEEKLLSQEIEKIIEH